MGVKFNFTISPEKGHFNLRSQGSKTNKQNTTFGSCNMHDMRFSFLMCKMSFPQEMSSCTEKKTDKNYSTIYTTMLP